MKYWIVDQDNGVLIKVVDDAIETGLSEGGDAGSQDLGGDNPTYPNCKYYQCTSDVPGNWYSKVNGADYDIELDAARKSDTNPLWVAMRNQRESLLNVCDWTQVDDSPLKANASWLTYRTDLRNLPANTTDPESVSWPTQP